jgi:hypothetical protein
MGGSLLLVWERASAPRGDGSADLLEVVVKARIEGRVCWERHCRQVLNIDSGDGRDSIAVVMLFDTPKDIVPVVEGR